MATPSRYVCRLCNTPGHSIQQCHRFKHQVPNNDYICKICGKQGHWIQQCPLKHTPSLSTQLPPNYICKICGKTGHWIQHCPFKPNNYICNICKQPGHLIQNCPFKQQTQNHSSSQVPSNYICKICGKAGHWIQHCPSKNANYICKICQKPGHLIQQCPLKQNPNQLNQAQVPDGYICKICQKSGHWIQQCPLKDKAVPSQLPDNYICKICHQPGHWIKDCPNYVSSNRQTSTQSNMHKNNSNLPPPNYVCNKCKKPGHWIKDCKAQFFVAPSGYLCNLCKIPGHWKEQCPQNDMDNLSTLDEKELKEIAKQANMSHEDIQKWVLSIQDYQWTIIKNIDSGIGKYYDQMEVNEYKNKFLNHFKSHNLKPNVFIHRKRLYNLCDHGGEYIGWDENFRFIFRVDEKDRNILMLDLIKTCFDDIDKVNRYGYKFDMTRMLQLIGLDKTTNYHIDLRGVDSNCKYCYDPGLYNRYLVDGYIKSYLGTDFYVPHDIIPLMILYFDINSLESMERKLIMVDKIKLNIKISVEGKSDRIRPVEVCSYTNFSRIKKIILTKESKMNEIDKYRLQLIRSGCDIVETLCPKDYDFEANQMLFLSRV